MKGRMGKLYRFKLRFGKNVPDIVFDGIPDPVLLDAQKLYPPEKRICIRNNQGATYANIDAANDFKKISRDPGPADCTHDPLPGVKEWF
jgi:hypothetical protein